MKVRLVLLTGQKRKKAGKSQAILEGLLGLTGMSEAKRSGAEKWSYTRQTWN